MPDLALWFTVRCVRLRDAPSQTLLLLLECVGQRSPKLDFEINPLVLTSVPKGNTIRGNGKFGCEIFAIGVRSRAG